MNMRSSSVILYITGCDSLDSVEQTTRFQTAVEGSAVTINCQYETTDVLRNVLWYQQKVNGFAEYMLDRFGTNENQFKGRFNADLNTISKSFPLKIQDVSVSDSAVYYCALKPTVTQTNTTFIQKQCVRAYLLFFNLICDATSSTVIKSVEIIITLHKTFSLPKKHTSAANAKKLLYQLLLIIILYYYLY